MFFKFFFFKKNWYDIFGRNIRYLSLYNASISCSHTSYFFISRCQEPIEMRGYTMKHLHDIHRNMRCLDKYGNRPEKDGAMLLGALIGKEISKIIFLII